jgi:hypothetical protein
LLKPALGILRFTMATKGAAGVQNAGGASAIGAKPQENQDGG